MSMSFVWVEVLHNLFNLIYSKVNRRQCILCFLFKFQGKFTSNVYWCSLMGKKKKKKKDLNISAFYLKSIMNLFSFKVGGMYNIFVVHKSHKH